LLSARIPRGGLILDGKGVTNGSQNSTFETLTDGKDSLFSVVNGATLTQVKTGDDYKDLTINGSVLVSGTSNDEEGNVTGNSTLTVSGDTTLKSTGTIALYDSAIFTAENVTLETGAQIKLKNGAVANITSLDLSDVDMTSTTPEARAAVLVDGSGDEGAVAATITVDTLTINNGEEKNRGTIQLVNGGKFYATELAAGSSITLTEADGAGNVWLDAASQFTLRNGNLTVTEATRGEIIAEETGANVKFDTAGKDFELSGIGTENLVIGESFGGY